MRYVPAVRQDLAIGDEEPDTPSRRPLASCWARTPAPVARKRVVASRASASSITSTGATRFDTRLASP